MLTLNIEFPKEMVFSPSGSIAVAGFIDGNIQFWYSNTGTASQTLEATPELAEAVAFSPVSEKECTDMRRLYGLV